MADYRVAGKLKWASQSGNAVLAFVNANGSNKKVTLTSLEIYPQIRTQTVQQQALLGLARCSSVGEGQAITAAKNDSNSASLPSQVKLWEGGAFAATETLRRISVCKQFTGALALARLNTHDNWGCSRRLGGRGIFSGADATAEDVVVRAGESVALYPISVDVGIPLRVDVEFASGSVTYHAQYITYVVSDQAALFAIDNGVGSGVTLNVKRVRVSELGEVTTPFFQLVPVSSVSPERQGDVDSVLSPLAMDTASGVLSGSVAKVVQDAPCLPTSGIPEQYMSDASAGSPKGVSYLHTKDYLGPAWRVQFPEVSANGLSTLPGRGFAGSSLIKHRMVDPKAPIVLRPGESAALVTSAELATGTVPVSLSGHMPFDYGATLRVEDLVTPTITFTGLPAGAKVCIVESGSETLVTTLTESGGAATYSGFTASPGTYFDARILAAGYVFQQIDDIEKLAEVQTYPVQLQDDLIYDSGLSEGVTFSGSGKRIICDGGNTSISVPAVYTEWVDWALTGDNLQYYHAFENQGGAVIDAGAGTEIPKYCYLVNSWRVRPQEANHTLSVTDGILLVEGGGDPFVNTLGAYTVRILYQQPVQAITVATGGGGGGGDWTSTEKEHIRNRLGIDGSASAPSATPNLPVTLQDGAITAAKIAANAIDADAIAADAVMEIQAGLALDVNLTAVQAGVSDVQSRLPAALSGGRIEAHVGSVGDGVLTAAKFAADALEAIADAVLTRNVSAVEASAAKTTVAGIVLKLASRTKLTATELEIYETNGTTLFAAQARSVDVGLQPTGELGVAS